MVITKWVPAAASLLAATMALFSASPARAAAPAEEKAPAGSAATAAPADERAASAEAQPAPVQPGPVAPKPGESPAIHHSPIASARSGEPLSVNVVVERPHLLKNAYVVYRANDSLLALPLLRSGDGGYTSVIPAEHVKPPGLGYTIEMERLDGTRAAVLGTRDDLQPIVVQEDITDAREHRLLDRLGGRRSVAAATFELIRFGTTTGDRAIPCAANQGTICKAGQSVVPSVDDQYWRAEGSYTYRPLRTVSEFSFRAGVVRGRSLVELEELDDEKLDVGLNYAGADVRFRLADIFHVNLEVLGSVSEVGFSTGLGLAAHLGDPYGTKFSVGWQTIGFSEETYFGTRFYARLDLAATERITLAPTVEVTDMPHAGTFGVRLLADAGFVIGRGFSIWLRGGYQARISRSGGPAAGATVQLAF